MSDVGCSADTRATICESKDLTCLISMAAEMEALFQVESTRGSGNCARSRGLACLSHYTAKTLNPWSAVGLWIIPAPLHFPPSPRAIHLLSSSSLVNIWGLAELRLSPPQSCTLERREAGLHTVHLIFYFCYCQRNMQKSLRCCILNVLVHFLSMLLHTYTEQLFLMDLKCPKSISGTSLVIVFNMCY